MSSYLEKLKTLEKVPIEATGGGIVLQVKWKGINVGEVHVKVDSIKDWTPGEKAKEINLYTNQI